MCLLKAQFLGHFGPQSKTNFWCLVTFSKSSHWFHNSIASYAHSKYFYMCGEYGPQRPNYANPVYGVATICHQFR